MDRNQPESSINSAPTNFQQCKNCTRHSWDPRTSNSAGDIRSDVGGSLNRHLPKYSILQASDQRRKLKASEILYSTKCSRCINCRSHENQVNENIGEARHSFNVGEESYSLSPFHSFKKACSRKRIFTFLDSDHAMPTTLKPRGRSAQDMPVFANKGSILIGDPLTPCVTISIGEDDNLKAYHAIRCRGNQSPSSSKCQNCISGIKLDSMSSACTEAKDDSCNEAVVFKEQIEKQGSTWPKNVPFSFHRGSTLTVSAWRNDGHNVISPDDDFLQVKTDYRVSQILVETPAKECGLENSQSSLLPRSESKSELNRVADLQHEAPGKPLCLRGEACQSVYFKSQDGEQLRTLIPSWIENYSLTRQNTEADSFKGFHDDRGSALSMQSANNGLHGMFDVSPTCNYNSNLVGNARSSRYFSDEGEDKICDIIDSDRVDPCLSSSARANAVETSFLSKRSSKCLSSLEEKKDFSSNENSKRLKYAENIELDHAVANADKLCGGSMLSPTISYNKLNEQELFDINTELTPHLDPNSMSSEYMGLSTSGTASTGKDDFTSRAKIGETSNLSIPFKSSQNTSSKWVKRLKLHPMDSFALGTRSFNIDNATRNGRVDRLYMRVLNYSRSNSSLTLATHLDQQKMEKSASPSSSQVDSHVESLKKSHTWIGRLCCSSQTAANTRMTQEDGARGLRQCGRESAKTIPGNLEQKLLPSIAAMALMGKAVNNFRPCEFRRKGSSVVWNTEGF